MEHMSQYYLTYNFSIKIIFRATLLVLLSAVFIYDANVKKQIGIL